MATPMSTSMEKAVLKMRSASGAFPSPSLMPARGAPPSPMRFANACMMSVMGSTMPSAASASMPASSMRATYIRSTMLYKNVMSCAMIAGMLSRTISGRIAPWSSSAVLSRLGFGVREIFGTLFISCVQTIPIIADRSAKSHQLHRVQFLRVAGAALPEAVLMPGCPLPRRSP